MLKNTLLATVICLIYLSSANAATKSEVRLAQSLLNKLGYNAGTVDGAYGNKTRSALEIFYSDSGGKFDGTLDANEISDLEEKLRSLWSEQDWISTDISAESPQTAMYRTELNPSQFFKKVVSMTKVETLLYLHTLSQQNNRIMPYSAIEQSLVFVVFDDIPEGTEFKFSYTLETTPDSPMYGKTWEWGDIPIVTYKTNTTNPTIIVKGIWMQFDSEYEIFLRMNGKLIGSWELSAPIK